MNIKTKNMILSDERELENSLDPGISKAVMILRREGIETYESCEGGSGHAYSEPTVRFHGEYGDGFKAFAIAKTYGLLVSELRRVYSHEDNELKGPWWEITFTPTKAD